MSWSEAIRRPRVFNERRDKQLAYEGDLALLSRLAAAEPHWTPMAALGGYPGSQAVYRLRNTYGSDIIESLTGRGYRLSKRGLQLVREREAA